MLLLLAMACEQEVVVELDGIVVASRTSTAGLPGARVSFVDEEGVDLATVSTDALGAFDVRLPAGINVFTTIEADGYVASTFPGVIGLAPTQQVDGYALYGVSEAEHAALLATWTGCPGLDEEGLIVVGEQRVYGLTDDTDNAPSVNTGIATLRSLDGEGTRAGCYLTDDGTAYDASAERTGASGTFLVAGGGPGNWELDVAYEYGFDQWVEETYPVWAPPSGAVVSPWYPAWLLFAY